MTDRLIALKGVHLKNLLCLQCNSHGHSMDGHFGMKNSYCSANSQRLREGAEGSKSGG